MKDILMLFKFKNSAINSNEKIEKDIIDLYKYSIGKINTNFELNTNKNVNNNSIKLFLKRERNDYTFPIQKIKYWINKEEEIKLFEKEFVGNIIFKK